MALIIINILNIFFLYSSIQITLYQAIQIEIMTLVILNTGSIQNPIAERKAKETLKKKKKNQSLKLTKLHKLHINIYVQFN